MSTPKILLFAGSTRAESFNKKLARVAADAVTAAGGTATFLDLKELALPLFDEELEAAHGLPEGAQKLKALLVESDGFIIASPEYNSSVTPALKNALDWASRATSKDEAPLSAYRGKVAALLSASPGALGGLRGLVHLRSILGNIGVTVLPDQLALPVAHEAFDADGKLKDERKQQQVAAIAKALVTVLGKLKA